MTTPHGHEAEGRGGDPEQAFWCELLAALDALPEKRLISGELTCGSDCCAIGALVVARNLEDDVLNGGEESDAEVLGITYELMGAVTSANDFDGPEYETEEERHARMRAWVASQIQPPASESAARKDGGR